MTQTDHARLIAPDKKYAASFAEALREGLNLEPAREKDILLAERDLDAYMKKRHDLSRPVILPNRKKIPRVPQTDLWMIADEKFIGMASLRPKLNDALLKRGGNIGYAVRASERRKGYGRLILQLALPHLKALGLERALITCHDRNAASIRIIESQGGVLIDTIDIRGLDIPERRYLLGL